MINLQWLEISMSRTNFYVVCLMLDKNTYIVFVNMFHTLYRTLRKHTNIVKLGFTGVYIIFLIFAQNIASGYSLEPPPRGGSNEYPQSMF